MTALLLSIELAGRYLQDDKIKLMRKRLTIVVMVVLASLGIALIRQLSGQRSELVSRLEGIGQGERQERSEASDEKPREKKSIKEVLNLEKPNSVTASNPQPRSWLVIEEVRVEAPGFAVIYEEDSAQAGDVLGSSKILPAGKSEDVAVFLRRDLREGEEIFIGLRIDDGDGFFEISGKYDKNVVRADGRPILEKVVVGQ